MNPRMIVNKLAYRCVIVFLACHVFASAAWGANEALTLTVDVSQNKAAGIGFGQLTDAKVFDLTVNLDVSGATLLTKSWVSDQGGRLIFVQLAPNDNDQNPATIATPDGVTTHSYRAVGVKANYGHSAKFAGNFKDSGGAGAQGGPDFEAKLSDVDLDVDSDNNGAPATNRLPSGLDGEDQIEYVTGGVGPITPMGLRAINDEIIAIKAKLRKKKDGTFTVTAPGVTFYVDAVSAAAGNDPTKVVDWSTTDANGKIGYMKVTADKTITATFTPAEAGGRQGVIGDATGKSEDIVNVIKDSGTCVFSVNPIVTGYSLPVASSTLSKTVVATISPAADAANVNFRIKQGTQDRTKAINIVSRNTTTGKVTFNVLGGSATPSTEPYGDTTLEAYKGTPPNENVLAEVQVIVVVPTTQTHTLGSFTWQNLAQATIIGGQQVSVPASNFIYSVSIDIYDQFANHMDNVYDGSVEQAWSNVIPGGSFLDGTILDPLTSEASQMANGILTDYIAFIGEKDTSEPLTQAEANAWLNKQIIRPNGANTNNASGFRGANGIQISTASGDQEIIVRGHHLAQKFSRNKVYTVVKDATTAHPLVGTDTPKP